MPLLVFRHLFRKLEKENDWRGDWCPTSQISLIQHVIMELFVKQRRIQPSSSWFCDHLCRSHVCTHYTGMWWPCMICETHFFLPCSTKLVRVREDMKLWKRLTRRPRAALRCYLQSLCIPSLPLLSLNQLCTSPPVHYWLLLQRCMASKRGCRPKYKAKTSANWCCSGTHPPTKAPPPKTCPMWLPPANSSLGRQLFAIAVCLSDNQAGACRRGHPSHSSACWRGGLLGYAEATP